MGGLGIPNLSQKAHSLVVKWMLKLEEDKPWAIITRNMIENGPILEGPPIYSPKMQGQDVHFTAGARAHLTSWKSLFASVTWISDKGRSQEMHLWKKVYGGQEPDNEMARAL